MIVVMTTIIWCIHVHEGVPVFLAMHLNLNLNLAHLQSSRGTENDVGIKLAKGSLIVNVVRMMIHANTKEQGERGRRYKRNIDTNYRLYRYRYTCPTS